MVEGKELVLQPQVELMIVVRKKDYEIINEKGRLFRENRVLSFWRKQMKKGGKPKGGKLGGYVKNDPFLTSLKHQTLYIVIG